MKLKYVWIILTLILGYGLLPVTLPDYSDNYSQSNILLIDRQECGCPCAEGVIRKGQLKFSPSIKQLYPTLNENGREITIIDFPPYNDITMEKPETFDFANGNTFKVTGQVVGVDTILCDPTSCEIVPKFKVDSWTLTSYYPRFWKFGIPTMLTYFGLWIIGLPIVSITTFVKWEKKKANKQTQTNE
jgi:hypothetical protein